MYRRYIIILITNCAHAFYFAVFFTLQAGALAAAPMAVNEGEVIYTICTRRNGQSSIREEENQEFKVEAYRVLNR